MILKFLSAIAPVLICLDADKGGGSGGTTTEKKTEETTTTTEKTEEKPEQEPKPEGETLESRFNSATGIISGLWTRLQAILTTNKRLNSQFESALQEAKEAKAESQRLTGELQTEKDAHKTTSTKLVDSESNVTRLEKLCGLRGIDPKSAVKPDNGSGTKSGEELYSEWQDLKKSNPAKASAFRKQHNAALEAYAESQAK